MKMWTTSWFYNDQNNYGCVPGDLFYLTVASFGEADVNLPKRQKVGEVASAAQELLHIKDER